MSITNIRMVEAQPGGVSYEVRYSQAGDVSHHNRTVLFLPFWGGTSRTYELVTAHLLNGISLSISYPGTGNTPVPKNDDLSNHSIPAKAQQLSSILADPDILKMIGNTKLLICAHSMSAKVAYQLISQLDQNPSFVDIKLAGLLLLGPAPVGPLVLPEELRQQSQSAYENLESAEWTVQNVLTAGGLPHATVLRAAEDCISLSPGAKRSWLEHGMQYDCTDAVDIIGGKFPKLRVHVLIGEKDVVEPETPVREKTCKILEARGLAVSATVIPESGHLIPVEAAERVVEAVTSMTVG